METTDDARTLISKALQHYSEAIVAEIGSQVDITESLDAIQTLVALAADVRGWTHETRFREFLQRHLLLPEAATR